MLGVRQDASHDEIKRAYLDLALKHHPDRQGEAPGRTRRDAEHRMQEVNAAWEVLRSPGRRAAYDAELRGVRPVWETARPRAPRTSTVRLTSDGPRPGAAPGGPTPPGFEVPGPAAPFLRFGPILVILVILAGILVFTAYATSQDSSDAPSGDAVDLRTGSPFADGSCVQLASVGGRIMPQKVTNCASPAAHRVEATVDLGRPCPAGSEGFDIPTEELRLCLVRVGP